MRAADLAMYDIKRRGNNGCAMADSCSDLKT